MHLRFNFDACALDASKSQRACIILSKFTRKSNDVNCRRCKKKVQFILTVTPFWSKLVASAPTEIAQATSSYTSSLSILQMDHIRNKVVSKLVASSVLAFLSTYSRSREGAGSTFWENIILSGEFSLFRFGRWYLLLPVIS